jgi:hypothetical protein
MKTTIETKTKENIESLKSWKSQVSKKISSLPKVFSGGVNPYPLTKEQTEFVNRAVKGFWETHKDRGIIAYNSVSIPTGVKKLPVPF